MRSGDKAFDRNDEYYRGNYNDLSDHKFKPIIFKAIDALELIERINNNRICKAYHGGRYDKGKYNLAKGLWDHEHCSVCLDAILAGQSCWVNSKKKELICDECHDYYVKT